VDAFEWKAPVDAIGRGDDTLLIEERPFIPARQASAPPALGVTRVGPAPQPDDTIDTHAEARHDQSATETPRPKTGTGGATHSQADRGEKPAIFMPERPPDDPGIVPTETEESPSPLERLRAAQIR
jgi:uncharacterized membrane-anchored protein